MKAEKYSEEKKCPYRSIIIDNGDQYDWYDVIKYKNLLPNGMWCNALQVSFRLRINYEDYIDIIKTSAKNENKFPLYLVKENGDIYKCETTLNSSIVMSKHKYNDSLCKLEFIIWSENIVSKKVKRNMLLSEMLKK